MPPVLAADERYPRKLRIKLFCRFQVIDIEAGFEDLM
jgi:hypothetical protein